MLLSLSSLETFVRYTPDKAQGRYPSQVF